MKTITVAVFPRKSAKGYRFNAYTRDYNAEWDGCNLVEVEPGPDAKKRAIEIVRGTLLLGTPDQIASIKVAKN